MSSELRYSTVLTFLRSQGYEEVSDLHQSAEFTVRGDTLTFWPVTSGVPCRLTFFSEDLEETAWKEGELWKKSERLPELVANVVPNEHGTIKPGDYIVHPNHGVGTFERILTQPVVGDGMMEYVALRYAGNDRLLFPRDRQAELMPYIGSRHPRLTRLYSKSWQNTKERVAKDLFHIARELLKIYAARQLAARPRYTYQGSFAEQLDQTAGFTLTGDQRRTLEEIRYDLCERDIPMDRLLCGDVGFGKTEVAIRAAVQVVAGGKQVALIAPTTVLAEQHAASLKRRLADLPITVDHVSRLTAGREKETTQKLLQGGIDILVGTHRLLGKDIQFKDLGLLILDEEQKFGVAQKETLKRVRPTIDVLSLSATPIPRTLSMSLSGLRGLSMLREPPHGRLPIDTKVASYSDAMLQQALVAEIERGGQVYVVHNRVQSLGAVEQRVRRVLTRAGKEDVTIGMAHGQLDETLLAKTMADFMAGATQILVASSIVEHGLDVPAANTLVVLHSEWFGLSDLYQLRGRVGRRQEQAYAYFMTGGIERQAFGEAAQEDLLLTQTAKRRLEALLEADQLGSGWTVALRDLEIRGGGNILGNEQHGSMEAIGLLLYSQLLQEAIGKQARSLGIPLFHNEKKTEEASAL